MKLVSKLHASVALLNAVRVVTCSRRLAAGLLAVLGFAGLYCSLVVSADASFSLSPETRFVLICTAAALVCAGSAWGIVRLAVGHRLVELAAQVESQVRRFAGSLVATAEFLEQKDCLRLAPAEELTVRQADCAAEKVRASEVSLRVPRFNVLFAAVSLLCVALVVASTGGAFPELLLRCGFPSGTYERHPVETGPGAAPPPARPVRSRPKLTVAPFDFVVSYNYPEYTEVGGRESRGGDVDCIVGTEAKVSFCTAPTVTAARLVVHTRSADTPGGKPDWRREGLVCERVTGGGKNAARWQGRMLVVRSGHYTVELSPEPGGESGESAPVLTNAIVARRDLPPACSAKASVAADGEIECFLTAWDDYGISSVTVVFEAEGDEVRRREVYVPAAEGERFLSTVVKLSGEEFAGAREVTYFVRAYDNCEPEPKVSRSPARKLVLPAAPVSLFREETPNGVKEDPLFARKRSRRLKPRRRRKGAARSQPYPPVPPRGSAAGSYSRKPETLRSQAGAEREGPVLSEVEGDSRAFAASERASAPRRRAGPAGGSSEYAGLLGKGKSGTGSRPTPLSKGSSGSPLPRSGPAGEAAKAPVTTGATRSDRGAAARSSRSGRRPSYYYPPADTSEEVDTKKVEEIERAALDWRKHGDARGTARAEIAARSTEEGLAPPEPAAPEGEIRRHEHGLSGREAEAAQVPGLPKGEYRELTAEYLRWRNRTRRRYQP